MKKKRLVNLIPIQLSHCQNHSYTVIEIKICFSYLACGSNMPSAESLNCTQTNGTFYNATCYYRDVVGEEAYSDILNITNITSRVKPISPSDEYFQ